MFYSHKIHVINKCNKNIQKYTTTTLHVSALRPCQGYKQKLI